MAEDQILISVPGTSGTGVAGLQAWGILKISSGEGEPQDGDASLTHWSGLPTTSPGPSVSWQISH